MFDPDKIVVLDELEGLMPALTDRQLKNLEESLIEEGGAISDLWVWIAPDDRAILVDGHNRYKLCRMHDLPFAMKRVFETAKTIEEVMFRMRKAAVGQRNLPEAIEQHHRGQMILHRVEQKKEKPTKAVKEVSKDVGLSERQCWRDYDRAKIMAEMPDSLQTEGVQGLCLQDLKKFDMLGEEEQLAAVERAGNVTDKIAHELRRMATVKGTPLYNAEKAAKKKKADKEREVAVKKGLFVVCLEHLGKANKAMRSIKTKHKIPPGKFSKIHDLLQRLDKAINQWKDDYAAKES